MLCTIRLRAINKTVTATALRIGAFIALASELRIMGAADSASEATGTAGDEQKIAGTATPSDNTSGTAEDC